MSKEEYQYYRGYWVKGEQQRLAVDRFWSAVAMMLVGEQTKKKKEGHDRLEKRLIERLK